MRYLLPILLLLTACSNVPDNHGRTFYPGLQSQYKWNTLSDYDKSVHEEYSNLNLKSLNKKINSVKYVTDSKNYGVNDKWVTPDLFFIRGGDCEDYAIAKYYTLKYSGKNVTNSFIAIGKNELGVYHAVLVHDGLVLDNETDDIIPLTKRTDLKIEFMINENGVMI